MAAATEIGELMRTSMNTVARISEEKKTMKSQEYASIRHVVPKSKISRAILHDNTSRDRVLEKQIRRLDLRCHRFRLAQEQNMRTFMHVQKRKAGKWRSDDETRLKAMNLPVLNENVDHRPSGAEIVYRNPRYNVEPSLPIYVPLREQMSVDIQRTEIIKFQSQAFLARLPSTIDIPQQKMNRYDSYRGKNRLTEHWAVTDNRFQRLTRTLVPAESLTSKKLEILGKYLKQSNDENEESESVSKESYDGCPKQVLPLILPKRFTPKIKFKQPVTELNAEQPTLDQVTHDDVQQETGKTKIMTDVKSKSLRELSHNYGFITTGKTKSLHGPVKDSATTGIARERTEIVRPLKDTTGCGNGEDERIRLPTLQLYFAKRSNTIQ